MLVYTFKHNKTITQNKVINILHQQITLNGIFHNTISEIEMEVGCRGSDMYNVLPVQISSSSSLEQDCEGGKKESFTANAILYFSSLNQHTEVSQRCQQKIKSLVHMSLITSLMLNSF